MHSVTDSMSVEPDGRFGRPPVDDCDMPTEREASSC